MKKHALFAVIVLLAICGGLSIVALSRLPERTGITKANFDRIATGMTVEEVDEVFGTAYVKRGPYSIEEWEDENGTASITFFDGKATEMNWRAQSVPIWQRVCGWFTPTPKFIPAPMSSRSADVHYEPSEWIASPYPSK